MKLLNIQLTSFRCFCHLEVSFEPGTTVFVAENGKGKTTILEGVSYLLGQFIRRFKGVPTPSAKDVDFREEWVLDEQGEMLTKSQCGPYMVLSALADFSEAGGAQEKVVAWDIIRARDKSDATVKLRKPETYGVKELWHQADWLIDSDNRGCPIP